MLMIILRNLITKQQIPLDKEKYVKSLIKLYFTAPEIFNGKLTEKSEIWASGVILHVLLTGELPFNGRDENEIYKNIQDNKI